MATEVVIPKWGLTIRTELGGLQTADLCVAQLGPDCDTIVVANAAAKVSVETF